MTDENTRTSTCPSCGKEARGNFCHHCGASLGGRFCNQCGNELEAGARFCNQCGASVGKDRPTAGASGGGRPSSGGGGGKRKKKGGASRSASDDAEPLATRRQVAAEAVGGSNLPWWIAGAALFGLILVVGWSMVRPAGPAAPQGGEAAGGGAPAGGAPANPAQPGVTDISQMTPREAADRLFERVMTDVSQGDTAAAMGFQPMAVQAYVRAEPLDLDGLFHKALLELLADPSAALSTAQRLLDEDPNHILGLAVAARASLAMGDEAAASDHYEQLLAGYEEEASQNLPEYQLHPNLLTDYRAEARAFLDGG